MSGPLRKVAIRFEDGRPVALDIERACCDGCCVWTESHDMASLIAARRLSVMDAVFLDKLGARADAVAGTIPEKS